MSAIPRIQGLALALVEATVEVVAVRQMETMAAVSQIFRSLMIM